MKWREGECIMDTNFPSFDSYLVIDDSSSSEGEEQEDEEEEEEQQQQQQPKPSTSRVGSPPDLDVKNGVDSIVTFFCNKQQF